MRTDVEDKDAPEDLFDRARDCLFGVGGLSSGYTDPTTVRIVCHRYRRDQVYISVPANSVPATTNVLATPLIESAKAPGSSQYLKPMASPPMPPALMQMARIKKTVSDRTLILCNISQFSLHG